MDCIQEKVSATDVAQEDEAEEKGNQKLQKITFLYDYFTQEEWVILTSEKQSLSSKQKLIANRLGRLGVKYPAEPVFKLCTAILLLGSHQGPPETLQVSWAHAFATLQDTKTVVRATGKFFVASGIKIYPDRPGDLEHSLLRKAYLTSGPAVPCAMDVQELLALAWQLPARKTHAKLAGQGPALVQHSNSAADSRMSQYMPMGT